MSYEREKGLKVQKALYAALKVYRQLFRHGSDLGLDVAARIIKHSVRSVNHCFRVTQLPVNIVALSADGPS